MKKKIFLSSLISVLCIVLIGLSGCTNIFPPPDEDIITYKAQPTVLLSHFSYGYQMNISASKPVTITYTSSFPQPFNGSVFKTQVSSNNYAMTFKDSSNTIVLWNISSINTFDGSLDINTSIQVNDFLISDLTGKDAITLEEIAQYHPDLIQVYCQVQGNGSTRIIDPENSEVQAIASSVKNKAKTNNAFLLAKELFMWVKDNTQYATHTDPSIQPVAVTLQKKTGDCDDLSSLYLSLCRALDIPSRFIRGYLYSEDGTTLTSVGHAWVDVYVGGSYGKNGWIPVECSGVSDATTEFYHNFGRENAFHIRLYEDTGTNQSFQRILSPLTIQYTQGTMTDDINRFFMLHSHDILASKSLCIKNKTYRYLCS